MVAPSCDPRLHRAGRRAFLASALGAGVSAGLYWLGLGARSPAPAPRPAHGMPWDELLDTAERLAVRARRRGPAFEQEQLGALARALAAATPPVSDGEPPGPGELVQERLCERGPLIACRYRFGPGSRLEVHDHVGYNGVLRVTVGAIGVATYELLGESDGDAAWPLRVRDVGRASLTPGDLGVVTLSGANIHGLGAGDDGAEVVDVFTIYREPAHSRHVLLGTATADGAVRARRGVSM